MLLEGVDGSVGFIDSVFIYGHNVLRVVPLEFQSEVRDFFLLRFGAFFDVFAFFAFKIENLLAHLEDERLSVVPLVFEGVYLLLPRLNADSRSFLVVVSENTDVLPHGREQFAGRLLVPVHLSDTFGDVLREQIDVFLPRFDVILHEVGPLVDPHLDIPHQCLFQGARLHTQPKDVFCALKIDYLGFNDIEFIDFFIEILYFRHIDPDSFENGIFFLDFLKFSFFAFLDFFFFFLRLEILVVQKFIESVVHLLCPQMTLFVESV